MPSHSDGATPRPSVNTVIQYLEEHGMTLAAQTIRNLQGDYDLLARSETATPSPDLLELAATWCEAAAKASPGPTVWTNRAKMLREGYKPQVVSAVPCVAVPIDRLRDLLLTEIQCTERYGQGSDNAEVDRLLNEIRNGER